MNLQDKIIAEKTALLQTIQDLIRIPSIESAPSEHAPFGTAVKEALEYMLTRGSHDGFIVKNVNYYGGHIEFPGETEEIVGITAHLDVVPEGDPAAWITPPFDPAIRNGCLYGRGAIDDKGPLAAVYHAMKILKDIGYKPQKTIRLILGCDEETNWNGMRYYLEHEKHPDCGFSPDGDFPVIQCEKGLLFTKFSLDVPKQEASDIKLLDFHGGTASNMVPDCAVITLECGSKISFIEEMAQNYAKKHPDTRIDFKILDTQIVVTCYGISAHGMMPWEGVNAVSIAFDLLTSILPKDHILSPFLSFYQDYIGFDLHGERFGRCFSDELSGDLIVNTGLVDFTDHTLSITINFRYPVTIGVDEITDCLQKLADSQNIHMETLEVLEPIYFPTEHPMVQILLETYRQHMNLPDAKPLVSAGATYARAIPNTLAFGAMFPENPDVCHQANEYISIDRLMSCLAIYTDVIPKLAGGELHVIED